VGRATRIAIVDPLTEIVTDVHADIDRLALDKTLTGSTAGVVAQHGGRFFSRLSNLDAGEYELGTTVGTLYDLNVPAVGVGDPPDNRESQPGSLP
jgi:hypothetical protein